MRLAWSGGGECTKTWVAPPYSAPLRSSRAPLKVCLIILRQKTPPFAGWGCMALWQALCSTPGIPQGLRESTLVEVASGHDMTVSDGRAGETAHSRSRQPKNPPASAVGSGQARNVARLYTFVNV